jgi:hypothetical protein
MLPDCDNSAAFIGDSSLPKEYPLPAEFLWVFARICCFLPDPATVCPV